MDSIDSHTYQLIRVQSAEARASNIRDITGKAPLSFEEYSDQQNHGSWYTKGIGYVLGGTAIGAAGGALVNSKERSIYALIGAIFGSTTGFIFGYDKDQKSTNIDIENYNKYLDEFSATAHAELKAAPVAAAHAVPQETAHTPGKSVTQAEVHKQLDSPEATIQR